MSNTEERRNIYPSPPPLMTIESIEDAQVFADNVQRHLSAVALYTKYRQASLLDVLNDDIISMSIDKLTAGTINVDSVFVGDDIELDGLLSQIRVLDDTPNVRVNIGRFGAGTDAGARFYDATGALRMEFADTTFIDGVIISDNTVTANALNVTQLSAITANMGALTSGSITGALIRTSASNPRVEMTSTGIAGYNSGGTVIFDLTTSGTVRLGPSTGNNILWNGSVLVVTGDIIATGNIKTNAVTNAKINDMSFSKITAGTISTTGAINFDQGADINMRAASSGDSNFITAKNSGGTDKGQIYYNPGTDIFVLASRGTAQLRLVSGSGVIGATTHIQPTSDNNFRLGAAGTRWSDVRSVLINGSDYCFENGFRLTEPNHVYKSANADDGIYFMNDDWEPIAYLTKRGDFYIKGYVEEGWDFETPDIARRESDN